MSVSQAHSHALGELTAEELDAEAERQRLLDAIAQGIADADAGRVYSHDEVVARMRARFAGLRQ